MKKFVLASLFVVAAAAMQPALAAKAAEPKLCGKGTKICACGKMPAAMWQCCSAKANPRYGASRVKAAVPAGTRAAKAGATRQASAWVSASCGRYLRLSMKDRSPRPASAAVPIRHPRAR